MIFDADVFDTTAINFDNTIWNKDPLFIEPEDDWNSRPDTLSPVIDMGIITDLTSDMTGIIYDGLPDIGAFEFNGADEEE